MTPVNSAPVRPMRVPAVDAMRGLVMVLLLPDLSSGFGLERMAQTHPDSAFWHALARPFGHVDWAGMALWDLVMPCFAFVIGASMVYSRHAGAVRPGGTGWWHARAVRRALVLVLLGWLVSFKPQSRLDELLPLLLVAVSWPAGEPGRFWPRPLGERARLAIEWGLWTAAIALAAGSVAARWPQLARADAEAMTRVVLVLLGGGYLLASLFGSARAQALGLGGLLTAWTLAFLAWPMLPAAPGELRTAWQNGSNLAAASDRWLFETLFGPGPFQPEPHGYHAIQVLPVAMLMLAGALAAQATRRAADPAETIRRLVRAGAAGLALAGALMLAGVPAVKSIWTPSYLAASSALMAWLLAWLIHVTPARPGPLWRALVVLGSNAILLYVLTYWEHWRLVALWQRLGGDAVAGSLAPLAQALWVLACLWLLAWGLYRARIFLRV